MNGICILSQISEVDFVKNFYSIILVIPNLDDLIFQAMIVNIERYFWLSELEDAAGIYLAKAVNAAEPPLLHRADPVRKNSGWRC